MSATLVSCPGGTQAVDSGAWAEERLVFGGATSSSGMRRMASAASLASFPRDPPGAPVTVRGGARLAVSATNRYRSDDCGPGAAGTLDVVLSRFCFRLRATRASRTRITPSIRTSSNTAHLDHAVYHVGQATSSSAMLGRSTRPCSASAPGTQPIWTGACAKGSVSSEIGMTPYQSARCRWGWEKYGWPLWLPAGRSGAGRDVT